MTTITYGATSALYLAIRTPQQLAKDERLNFPKARQVLEEDFYIDGVLSGGAIIEEISQLQQDLITILKKGGLKLRN